MTAVVKAVSRDYLFAVWRELFIAVWWGETTQSGVQRGQHFFNEHIQGHPAGVLLLTIIESQAPMPSAADRAALSELLHSGTGRIRRSAVVYEGTGFRAATVRSVVTGVSSLSRSSYPHEVFATVADAAFFLCEGAAATAMTTRELVDAVQEVRNRPPWSNWRPFTGS